MERQDKNQSLSLPPISQAVGRPLYEQVISAIKAEFGAGRLASHTPLPSFRELAAQLLVSMTTVRRAYEELDS